MRLAELGGEALAWENADWVHLAYELRRGTDVLATLRFRSVWGTFATAESAEGCWTFKRVGFLQTRVTIRRCGTDEEIAVFRNNTWTGGGTLEFADGRPFLANTNFWMTAFAFSTDGGEPLVHFRRIGGVLHLSAAVEITAAATAIAELPILMMLGWYLAIQLHNDTAASAGGAGGGGC